MVVSTDLQQTLDSLPRGHDYGGHHSRQRPRHGQLPRPQHLALPLLQVLPDPEAHEADGEGGDGDHNGGPHACKQFMFHELWASEQKINQTAFWK